jgi:hypothetical protein
MAEFGEIKDLILYAMYTNAIAHNVERWSINKLSDQIPAENQFLARKAIESLEVNGMLLRSSNSIAIVPLNDSNSLLEITGEGMDYVERQAKLFGSTIYNTSNSQASKPRGVPSPEVIGIPASNRVVSLNHNGDPYREAIRSLDAAVLAFKADHHLDNAWGPEKSALLKAIEAGRELLNGTEIRVATLFAIVISPLKIVRDRYQEAMVAGLVTAGVDQVIPLFSKAITALMNLLGAA